MTIGLKIKLTCQKYGLEQFMADDSLPKDLLGAQGQLGGLRELATQPQFDDKLGEKSSL